MITNHMDLLELVRNAADALGRTCALPATTSALQKKWLAWEEAVSNTLQAWARVHVQPHPTTWALRLLVEGSAPLMVWLTITGEGISISDGRWDEFFPNNTWALESLHKTLEEKLQPWVAPLEAELALAAYACSDRKEG